MKIPYKGPQPPDLTAGEKYDPKSDPWNLGATGAEGYIWAIPHKTTEGATQIYITEVKPNTPAEGVLKVGDVLIGAFGEKFTWDARKEFAHALTRAETTKEKGQLDLLVWNDGKTRTATVPMEVMGGYSASSPYDCPKTEKIVDDAVAHFKKYGLTNIRPGMPRNTESIYGLVNAIGLLATGREDVMPLVKKKIDQEKIKFPTDHTWTISYRLILLCEYYLATGDKSVLAAIEANAIHVARGQSLAGTWGHRIAIPYQFSDGTRYGVAPGYGAINATGTVAMVGIALTQKCGIDNDDIRTAMQRGARFLRFYSDKGAVTYGDHPPYFEVHDTNGKNSMAAVFFGLIGDQEYADYFIKSTIASYNERENGHTGNYFSFIWGALGAAQGGDDAAAAFMQEMAWFYDLERRVQGNFVYQGKPGMENKQGSEHQYIHWDCTGARLLAYCLPRKAIHLTGKNSALRSIEGDELENTIDAGRLDEKDYYDLSTQELLGKLTHWSPAVRHRASQALSGKPDNVVPQLLELLESENRFARYGALQGLAQAGRHSKKAVDLILSALELSDDENFKYFALNCFSGYDKKMGLSGHATYAAPKVMKLAFNGHFDEPTGKLISRFGETMFDPADQKPMHAFAPGGDGIENYDSELVLGSIRLMLQSKNGVTRSLASLAYDNLEPQQVQKLWPSIDAAVKELAPSGIMFASSVRLNGLELMGQNRVREGMENMVWLLTNQKFHKGKERTEKILSMLIEYYGGHAKVMLPELEKAAAYHEPGGIVPGAKEQALSIRATMEKIKNLPTPDWQLTSIAKFLQAE